MDDQTREVLVVGAGPIGIEIASALKAVHIGCQIVEAGCIGATMAWWAPGTSYFSSPERISIAGIPLVTPEQRKATREDYLSYLRQVVASHDLDVRTNTRVVGIEPIGAGLGDSGFSVTLAPSPHGVGGPEELTGPHLGQRHDTVRAHKLVLAVGNMHRPRELSIEGEDGPFVSHYLGDPHLYHGQRVLIVGGKNSAIEAAIRLYRVGADVTVSYRKDRFDKERVKYWLLPELEWLISKGRIGFLPETTPVSIGEGGGGGEGNAVVTFAESLGSRFSRGFDRVLLLTGYVQDQSIFGLAGVKLGPDPERRPVVDRRTLESPDAPGVFVAGTACGGSQERARLFIENCHVHAERIVGALRGNISDKDEPIYELEES